MDFYDERHPDLIKLSIKNSDSTQRVISRNMKDKIHMDWSDEDEYLGGESVLDMMVFDKTNWTVDYSGDVIKVTATLDEEPLVEIAKNHPQDYVRIAAISHIEDNQVLCSIIKNDSDVNVKKAGLNRLEELFIG